MSREVIGCHCSPTNSYAQDAASNCRCQDAGSEFITCDWCGKEIDFNETCVVFNGEDFHSGCYSELKDVEELKESDLLPHPPLDEVLGAAIDAVNKLDGKEVRS